MQISPHAQRTLRMSIASHPNIPCTLSSPLTAQTSFLRAVATSSPASRAVLRAPPTYREPSRRQCRSASLSHMAPTVHPTALAVVSP